MFNSCAKRGNCDYYIARFHVFLPLFLIRKEVWMINTSFTKKVIDHSTMAEYLFSFHCDLCDKSWRSPPLPFDVGVCAFDNEALRNVLWAQERRFAFNLASTEAMYHFNHCPVCGRWVCDDCFMVLDETDMCKECAGRQKT